MIDRVDGELWYTVECVSDGRTAWVAEFSRDELEPILGLEPESTYRAEEETELEPRPSSRGELTGDRKVGADASAARQKPERRLERKATRRGSSRNGRGPSPDRGPGSAEPTRVADRSSAFPEAFGAVAAGTLGAASAVALQSTLAPEGSWLLALALGAVFGLVGGLASGTLVEAFLVLVFLSGAAAILFATVSDAVLLTSAIAVCSGLGIGHLTASVYSELVVVSQQR